MIAAAMPIELYYDNGSINIIIIHDILPLPHYFFSSPMMNTTARLALLEFFATDLMI